MRVHKPHSIASSCAWVKEEERKFWRTVLPELFLLARARLRSVASRRALNSAMALEEEEEEAPQQGIVVFFQKEKKEKEGVRFLYVWMLKVFFNCYAGFFFLAQSFFLFFF